MFPDIDLSLLATGDNPRCLSLLQVIKYESQERAWRDPEQIDQIAAPHQGLELTREKLGPVEMERAAQESLMTCEGFGLLADSGAQVCPRVQDDKGSRVTPFLEEAVLCLGGDRCCAGEMDRPQMMLLEAGYEVCRRTTQSKAVAQASKDRQAGVLVSEEPDPTIRLYAPGLGLADIMQKPKQLKDGGLRHARFDLPIKPLT